MKWMIFSLFATVITLETQAQVIFRNDFVIGKHAKMHNKGLSFITISLDRYPNLNMLINGRGGRAIVIDVDAIRNPGQHYTYTQLAEKIYNPGPVYRPSAPIVPFFLLA